jgi:hypothetical protein
MAQSLPPVVDILRIIAGAVVIAQGVLAIGRGWAKASPEGEDERPYRGWKARVLGIVWIVLGVVLIFFWDRF